MKKYLLVAAAVLLAATVSTLADIAPDPGFKGITLRLLVEPAEELAEYRFFMKSGADIEEIALKQGEKTSIGPLGGGARYSAGKFIAVPKASLAGLSEVNNDGRLSDLRQAVFDGKAAGAIELIDHTFMRDVQEKAAPSWKDAVYRIEKDAAKGLKAVWVSGGSVESKTNGSAGTYYSTDPKSFEFWGAVIGGSLLTLAAILTGAWFFRRRTLQQGSI